MKALKKKKKGFKDKRAQTAVSKALPRILVKSNVLEMNQDAIHRM